MKLAKLIRCTIAAATATLSLGASAAVLSTHVSVDNGYQMYLSTSDTVPGVLFGAGNDWTTSFADSTTLLSGQDYYLHVLAYDQGGIAGFLGDFSLSGASHKFSNGLTTLTTNTTDWAGNNTAFNGSYAAVLDLGEDGVGPWGNRPNIDDTARWIWAGDAHNDDVAYFSTKISANVTSNVPEPGSLALLGLGLAGAAVARRRKAAR